MNLCVFNISLCTYGYIYVCMYSECTAVVMCCKAQSSHSMLNGSKHCSQPCKGSPCSSGQIILCANSATSLAATNPVENNSILFCNVRELMGLTGSPVRTRAGCGEQKGWRKGHCSFSIFSWGQFSGFATPAVLLEKPFSLSCDCGKSQGRRIFLVLALLSIPHSAYTRIYNSLTKQVTELIKVNPRNPRRMNFHTLTTSVSFNFSSFLVHFCNKSKAASHGPGD